MKIIIYGNPGSGKSTLAVRLHRLLKIPLYHLDQYFWKPNWQEPDRTQYTAIHNQLCDLPEWIIDGVSTTTLEYRLQKADVVIFLDVSRYVCLYRVLRRATAKLIFLVLLVARSAAQIGNFSNLYGTLMQI